MDPSQEPLREGQAPLPGVRSRGRSTSQAPVQNGVLHFLVASLDSKTGGQGHRTKVKANPSALGWDHHPKSPHTYFCYAPGSLGPRSAEPLGRKGP